MYNLSPRMGIPIRSQTPAEVGPTTYIICDERDRHVNVHPFASTKKRDTILHGRVYCETLYGFPDQANTTKNVPSLKYRAKRFVYKESDTPGPADYDLSARDEKETARSDPKCHKGRGKLYVCKVPLTHGASAPSIPTKIDENGYDIDEDKNIIKISANKHDTTLGPAFYRVRTAPCCGCEQYRGTKWSASKSKRCAFKTDDIPGPGHYSIEKPTSPSKSKDEEYREMARLFTFLPRFTEIQEIRSLKEGLPGPANYKITKGNIQPKKIESIKPIPFISDSPRFKRKLSDTPSPGIYNIEACTHKVSFAEAPFGSQTARFAKKKVIETPGPGSYMLKSPMMQKQRCKSSIYSTVHPPFNHTSNRDLNFAKKDAEITPSPAEYTLDGVRKFGDKSYMFKSKIRRFKIICKSDPTGPGNYDVSEAFNKIRNRKSHNRAKLGFNAGAKRSGLPGDTKEVTPGPSDYLSKGDFDHRGLSFNRSPRFEETVDEIPGPGAYWIHPSKDRSTYKAYDTHNLRLKESILQRKLRLAPNETYEKWAAGLNKRKTLRWFLNAGKNYLHCTA